MPDTEWTESDPSSPAAGRPLPCFFKPTSATGGKYALLWDGTYGLVFVWMAAADGIANNLQNAGIGGPTIHVTDEYFAEITDDTKATYITVLVPAP